jgi:predicted N-acyltransferase
VLRCIHRAVIEKAREMGAPMRVWKDFPEDFAADLQALAREEDLFRVVSFPGTELALPPGGKEAYLRALPGRHRERLKRNLKLSRREATLETTVCQSPDAADLDEVFALFWQTYERSSTRFERLNRGFFDEMAACAESRFILMRHTQDRRLVAFMLCFDLGSTLVNKFVGFDYERPREWRLYFRLWDAFVDLALSMGKERVESGQTGYSGKLGVGHRLLPLTNYCHHANPLLRTIYRAVGARVSWQSLDEDLAQHLDKHQD